MKYVPPLPFYVASFVILSTASFNDFEELTITIIILESIVVRQ